MSGLDPILDSIRESGDKKARAAILEAEKRVEVIKTNTESVIASDWEQTLGEARKQAEKTVSAAESAAEADKRRAVLKAKTELLARVLAEAEKRILDLPDDEYFSLMLKLAVKACAHHGGTVIFGQRDLARLPKDFIVKLNSLLPAGVSADVSSAPANIAGGFILRHGDIEENCSISAMMADRRDDLRDTAAKILFQ